MVVFQLSVLVLRLLKKVIAPNWVVWSFLPIKLIQTLSDNKGKKDGILGSWSCFWRSQDIVGSEREKLTYS